MKVALIGASGQVGSRILAELASRGHTTTAIVRHPEKIAKLTGVTAVVGDVYDVDGLVPSLRGHDAVISAVRFAASDPEKLIKAVRTSGVPRYLIVGGASGLEVSPGKILFDTFPPDLPAGVFAEAGAGIAFLKLLRSQTDLNWTFLSPSASFQAGERTGKFRLGKDQLLTGEKGSFISFEDFAVALVDELEEPKHPAERFTVGY